MKERMEGLAGAPAKVDAARFGDPVAMQAEWTPITGGAAIGDRLVKVSPVRWEFRASAWSKLAALLFMLTGVGIAAGLTYHRLSTGGLSFDKDTIGPIVIGLIFVASGIGLLYFGSAPVVFDKGKGFFWKGRTAPDEVSGSEVLTWCARLENVHALQLISEYCTGHRSGSYYRYLLNLVLRDGHRLNVIAHGSRDRIRGFAGELSGFLGKPVWDAIDETRTR
ncbi:MAG TPA: hypothetical protein PK213_07920 [Deltaproteobacteria bacterium]|nr:hypothetical protein [Deltaproteobacteria bacterium]